MCDDCDCLARSYSTSVLSTRRKMSHAYLSLIMARALDLSLTMGPIDWSSKSTRKVGFRLPFQVTHIGFSFLGY